MIKRAPWAATAAAQRRLLERQCTARADLRAALRAALRHAERSAAPDRPFVVCYGRGGGFEPRIHVFNPETQGVRADLEARGRRFRVLRTFGGSAV